MSKLITTGHITWRDGELQLAQYRKLSNEEKKSHIDFLLQMPPDELSFNDKYILYSELNYKYKFEQYAKNFFSLEEENANTSTNIVDDKLVADFLDSKINSNIDKVLDEYNANNTGKNTSQILEEIALLSKEDMRKILAKFFTNYNFWEVDLRNTQLELFLANNANSYIFDTYYTELVKAYKLELNKK